MKFSKNHASLGVVALAIALTACGKNGEPAAANVAPSGTQATPPAATQPAAQPNVADGNTLRLQGTMQVNAGGVEQTLQSYATVVDPKLGEKTAARLGTSQGQKSLADGNASIGAKSGVNVTSSDVQDIANSMAGRTMYTSEAVHIEITKAYNVTMDAKSNAKNGPRMQLSLTFSEKDLKLTAATAQFYPDGGELFESYKKKLQVSDVSLDKLERKDEKTFALSGSFKGTDLPAGVLAKTLKGQTLASLSGRFDFQEVPIRSMAALMNKLTDVKK